MDEQTQSTTVVETTPAAVTPTETTPAAPTEIAAAPPAPGSETPQNIERQRLYQKLYNKASEVTPPAAPTETAATPTPGESAPAEVTPTPTPDPTAAKIAQLEATVSALTEAIKSAAPPPKPADPATPAAEKHWSELFKEGDLEKGQEALKKALGVPDTDTVISEAVARVKAEQEIGTFVAKVKQDNADVMPLEDYITFKAQTELQKLVDAGKIKSLPEYVEQFKLVTTKSIEEARKLLQTARAAGKDEAMTIKKEVLSTSTIAPNTVNKPGETEKPAEKKPESANDYIAARTKAQYARQGMLFQSP